MYLTRDSLIPILMTCARVSHNTNFKAFIIEGKQYLVQMMAIPKISLKNVLKPIQKSHKQIKPPNKKWHLHHSCKANCNAL